jgi:hypothetical protein
MIKQTASGNTSAYAWIAKALLIKLVLFAFFSWCFHKYWPTALNLNYFFNASGDTSGYYDPCESFVQGNGYNSYCRMPGLLPVYYLLRLFFDITWTKTIIIFLQLICSSVSVYLLACIARYTFNSGRIFRITFYLYAISSFVSIWDHVGYSDSFGISFLIYSIYFLLRYKEEQTLKWLFISGVFMTWSVFFRPVHGIVIPLICLLFLTDIRKIVKSLKQYVVYGIPFVLCVGLWVNHNYKLSNKIIVLQGPSDECFPGITKEMLSIRDLITAWGGDIQPWAAGADGQWFFDKREYAKKTPLPESNMETSVYNTDSIEKLRDVYYLAQQDSLPAKEREACQAYVTGKSKLYLETYVKEKPARFYFLNRMRVLREFLIRKRLDDMPLPAWGNMNFFQKGLKLFYYLLLLVVNIFGTVGALLALRKKKYLGLVPLAFIVFFALLLRSVEQRYLAPIYFFNVVFLAYLLDLLWQKVRKKKTQRL